SPASIPVVHPCSPSESDPHTALETEPRFTPLPSPSNHRLLLDSPEMYKISGRGLLGQFPQVCAHCALEPALVERADADVVPRGLLPQGPDGATFNRSVGERIHRVPAHRVAPGHLVDLVVRHAVGGLRQLLGRLR